jgi:guanylate kinase
MQDVQPGPPLLVVLSGPSGVGKDAALAELKKLDRRWHFVVTATTRPQRSGERDGVDYIFLDTKTFLAMKARDELLECAEVYGRWYGVPRSQVIEAMQEGKDVILKIDVQGADTVRRLSPGAVFIFMLPASFQELRGRLASRMTESTPEMDLRLKTAEEEMKQFSKFDYRVINRDGGLASAVAEIDAIITAEKCRTDRRQVGLI